MRYVMAAMGCVEKHEITPFCRDLGKTRKETYYIDSKRHKRKTSVSHELVLNGAKGLMKV